MINKIIMKDIASFDETGQVIDDLEKINFVYGTNGSGKTTTSKVIADDCVSSKCSVEWENNNSLKTLVYNENFVENNFLQTDEIKGIFTLGEKSKEKEEKIKWKLID